MKLLKALTLSSILISASAFAVNCGDTITTKVKLTEDLNCSTHNGYSALTLRGNGILNGKGFKIITPNTNVGIYAEGNLIKVKNVVIEGNAQAIGVQGYNVKKLILNKVTANFMSMGVEYYSESNADCDRLRVSNSDLSSNNIGAKVFAPNCSYNSRFINSDFSNSGSTALVVSAKIVRILGKHNSVFDGSTNGFSLKGTEKVVVKDMDLSDSQISGTQIFVQSSKKVRVVDTILGNSDEGLHVYDSEEVIVNRSEVINANIGIKVANDRVPTSLDLKNSETGGNNIGLLVTSFGTTTFSNIAIDNNNVLDFYSIQNQ